MRFRDDLPDDSVNTSEQTPLRDAATIALGVVGLCAVLVISVAAATDLLVPHLPPSVEQRVFSVMDFDEDNADGARPDRRTAYVQTLVDNLAAHWAEKPFPLRVSIADDFTPNAFALPGGRIIVTEGLLGSVESESELALVLGHEIGHFEQRDHLRGLGRGLALGLVGLGLELGGAGGAMALVEGAIGFADRHFDRDQESGADRFGLRLVWAQYGDVSGATDFFAKLASDGADTDTNTGETEEAEEAENAQERKRDQLGQKIEGYFSTHPLDESRVRALNALADEQGWPRSGTPVPLSLPPAPEEDPDVLPEDNPPEGDPNELEQ